MSKENTVTVYETMVKYINMLKEITTVGIL